MCGIAGIIKFDNHKIDRKTIKDIKNTLDHRGPDTNGHWLSNDSSKALINTRLSIIDLTKNGKQPFYYANKRYIIVFNGEIYNYLELKKNLREYKFTSNTDTEVLLYLYLKHGSKCLDYLEGMFAFAIFDNKKKELFCARDRYGVKPLYYIKDKNNFYFASEIKTLKIQNIVKNEPNFRAVSSYLTSEYYENITYTFFKNIKKVKPGYYIKFREKYFKEENFTNFKKDFQKIFIPKKIEDKQKILFDNLNQAVRKSMVADVQCSLAASGGLDSSVLQLLIKNNSKSIINGISFGFEEKKYDEEKFVKRIIEVSKLKAKTHRIKSKNFFKILKKNIIINEEPFAGLPVIAYQECIKKLNDNKIILDGSGIDEMHFGYKKFLNQNYNVFSLAQDNSTASIKEIISENFLRKNINYDFKTEQMFEEDYKNRMYYDLFYVKLPRALRFRDKISMANSAELRPSFLDKNLINFFFNLDFDNHYKNNSQKFLLKKTFSEIYNNNLFYENKRQVQTPMREWFKLDLRIEIKDFIDKSSIWDYGIYNKKIFLKKYDDFIKNKINNAFFIWQLINLDLWFKINKF